MRIIIPVTTQYAEDFIEWLIRRIKSNIFLSLDLKKLYTFQTYQKNVKVFKPHNNTKNELDFQSALMTGVKSITYKKVRNNWIIYVPNNIPYKGYYATILSVCKFIDSGNSEVRGYPIFTQIFNGVTTNLSKYYNQFLKEFVL